MKPLKILAGFLCLVMYLCGPKVHAQSGSDPYVNSIGIHLGTQGLGINGDLFISDKFGARLGLSLLPFNTQVSKTYGSYQTSSDVAARFSNVHLYLDWTPLYSKSNFFQYFHVSGGLGYFFKAEGDFETHLTEDYYYGEIAVAPEDIGKLTTNISWTNSIAPYLGLGFKHIPLNEDFVLGFSLGSYYLSKPDVQMVGTKLLEGNESNSGIIERNAEDYRLLPILQVNFSYKLSR